MITYPVSKFNAQLRRLILYFIFYLFFHHFFSSLTAAQIFVSFFKTFFFVLAYEIHSHERMGGVYLLVQEISQESKRPHLQQKK